MSFGTRVASLIAWIGADTSNFEAGSKRVKGGLGSMQKGIMDLVPASVKGFLSIGGAIAGVSIAMKASIDATMAYAKEVRTLSAVSGESTENASRFIQVLDDYELTAQDALTATRTLTKQGLAPNIDTLAKLSDEYLALNSAEAKNELILKNLGRGGLEWVNVLKQGGAAIRAQGDAVRKDLILSQNAINRTEEYRMAVDELNDAKQGLATTIGLRLIPNLTKFLTMLASGPEFSRELTLALADIERRGLEPAARGYQEMARASEEANKTIVEDLESNEAAIRSLTEANQTFLGQVENLTDRNADYADSVEDVQKELDAGNITIEEAQQQWEALADEQEKATHRMILAMLEQELSIDGLTSEETDSLLALGVQWGIYSDTAIEEMRKARDEVARLTGAINGIPSSKRFDFSIYTHNYTSDAASRGQQTTTNSNNGVTPQQDVGGYGMAGQTYMIGAGAQPEVFTPSTPGMFTPKQDLIDYKKMARAIRDVLATAG